MPELILMFSGWCRIWPILAVKEHFCHPFVPAILQVVRLVRGIRAGLIKLDEKPKEEKQVYLMWGEDSNSTERHHVPAPKPKLPGGQI